MSTASAQARIYRLGMAACLCILGGALLSGPGAMLVVELTRPQPPWRDARTFADNYHRIQALPYFLGLFLIGGFGLLLPCLHALSPADKKARTGASLVFCAIAGALIFQNYVLQTTFVPHLARTYTPVSDGLIAALSMVNPSSFAWGLEMWGYGFLGVATWSAAGVFEGRRLERAAAWTFAANGWTSIVGALWTAAAPGWVMSAPGLILFALWNVLVVVMIALALAVLRRWSAAAAGSPGQRLPSATGG